MCTHFCSIALEALHDSSQRPSNRASAPPFCWHQQLMVDCVLHRPRCTDGARAAMTQGGAMTPDDTAHRDNGLGVLATEKQKVADEERSAPGVSALCCQQP